MALSKASAILINGATSTNTSSAADISASYETTAYTSIQQSTGAANTAATFKLQISPDGGNTYFDTPTYSAGTAVATYYWTVSIPDDATNVKAVFTQAGSNTSTCFCLIGKVTGV